jgi:hypothetical protein
MQIPSNVSLISRTSAMSRKNIHYKIHKSSLQAKGP